MRDIALGADGDLLIDGSDLVLFDGAERVSQQVEVKLKLWAGEWFLNTDFGTPYLSGVLGKGISIENAIEILKESAKQVDGVRSIDQVAYSFDEANRSLKLDMQIVSDYGIIKVKL